MGAVTALEDDYKDAYWITCDKFEELNDAIEIYLRDIDEKFGTDYCPSGFARERLAAKRTRDRKIWETAKNKALTEEQHELLEELCWVRHDVDKHRKDVINEESGYGEWHVLCDSSSDDYIPYLTEKVGLPKLDLEEFDVTSGEGIITDFDYFYSKDFDDYEEMFWAAWQRLDELDDKIKSYLRDIDEKFGTHYCLYY